MKLSSEKLLLTFLMLPLILFNNPLFLIFPLISCFFAILNIRLVNVYIFTILFFLTGIGFFVIDLYFGYIDFNNFKIFIFLLFLIVTFYYSKVVVNYDYLLKLMGFFVVLNFVIILTQMLIPNLPLWNIIKESDGHYGALLEGRMFGLSGNPTHSGYLSMLMAIFLIGLNARPIYILVSLVCVILLLNKMSLIILLTFGLLYYLELTKSLIKKLSFFIIGGVASFLILFLVVIPFFQRWAEVNYETHTITYRLDIYNVIYNSIKNNNLLLLGDSKIYHTMSTDAFDSLPALIIVKFGFLALLFIYIFPLFLIKKNYKNLLLYLIFFLPSLTMVAFYNTLYMCSIFLMFFILCNIHKKV